MGKKLLSLMLCTAMLCVMIAGVLPVAASADTGEMIVTIGADLTEEQKNMILRYFNVEGQYYTTITVTNDDEWAHLGMYMSRDIVGYKTISCALIRPMTTGGIQVKTANLTYVTSNMIASNLATAGVVHCEVLAAAPYPVSGTGALTGALMAYENLTGVELSESKKDVAVQEFATTYSLGQTVGQQEAQQIVNDVKMQVIAESIEVDNSVSEDQITEIVNNVVNNYTVNNTTNNNTTNNTTVSVTNNGLSEEEIAALQELAVQIARESYEQGTIDALAQIQQTLEGQTQIASTDATTQIVQEAAPTTETAQEVPVETGTGEGVIGFINDLFQPEEENAESGAEQAGSAADQALAEDSILTNTDESALVDVESGETVITSSTAESSIDETVSTNLDTLIEEEQGTIPEPEETQTEIPAEISTSGDTLEIPEPSDVAVIPEPGDAAVIPAPEDSAVPEPMDEPQTLMLRDTPITAADIEAGAAQFVSCGVMEDLSAQTTGVTPVALVLPYDGMNPISGTLRVTDENGEEAAVLTFTDPEPHSVVTCSPDIAEIPIGWEGYTAVLLLPKDAATGEDFVPEAGRVYTYTLEARFIRESDGAALDVAIDAYTPYEEPVSPVGFAVDGFSLTMPYADGLTGQVLFPEDGGAAYATVTADERGMASVSIDNEASGAYGEAGVTAGAGDTVHVQPIAPGEVTLYITYYSSAPEVEAIEGTAEGLCTAVCTLYFTE